MVRESEPVVIGGVRGSGTRVAAHLVRELGFYLGDDLNQALDNQCFGFLLGGRPDWYRTRPTEVSSALRLFERIMRGDRVPAVADSVLLREAVGEWEDRLRSSDREAGGKPEDWLRGRIRALGNSGGMPADIPGWGWKNPITHVFLEQLADAFPRMKYVHVIRDGRELAGKAKARREVELWGSQFGVEWPQGPDGSQSDAVLRYWELVNERALRLGPRLFDSRFLALDYEFVCAHPEDAVDALAGFLEVSPPGGLAAAFSAFVTDGEKPAR